MSDIANGVPKFKIAVTLFAELFERVDVFGLAYGADGLLLVGQAVDVERVSALEFAAGFAEVAA